MTWRDRPMMSLDCESTGINPETAHVVTACLGLATQQGWTAHTWLVTQAEPIPEQATKVHGITTEHANKYGVEPGIALRKLREDLARGWVMGMPLVVVNAPYDLTLLDREWRRHGIAPLKPGPVLDPLVMARMSPFTVKGGHQLATLCERYGIALGDDAHGAEADAHAGVRLAWKLGGLDAFRDRTLDELQTIQAAEYARQQEARAAKALGEGREYRLSTAWPVIPATTTERSVA